MTWNEIIQSDRYQELKAQTDTNKLPVGGWLRIFNMLPDDEARILFVLRYEQTKEYIKQLNK